MKSILYATDRAVARVKEMVESGEDLSALCRELNWGTPQINEKGYEYLNVSSPVHSIRQLAKGYGRLDMALRVILKLERGKPSLFKGIDLSPIHEARDFFYSAPAVDRAAYESGKQEAYSFAAGLFGYDISSEFPVPLATPPNGLAVIHRLSDILDVPVDRLVEKFHKSSGTRKAAMRALAWLDDLESGEGDLMTAHAQAHFSAPESTQACG